MCPHQELNPLSLSLWDDTPTNQATPARAVSVFFFIVKHLGPTLALGSTCRKVLTAGGLGDLASSPHFCVLWLTASSESMGEINCCELPMSTPRA